MEESVYLCWVYHSKFATMEIVRAESSFAARKVVCEKRGVDVFDCVAQRIREDETLVRAEKGSRAA